jgi:hypothetical protein
MTTKKHREPLATLPLEPEALSRLRALSAAQDTNGGRPDSEPPDSGVAPQSEPSETRAEMPTLPFELTAERASATDAPAPLPLTEKAGQPAPFELVRPSSRPPPAGAPRGLRWGVALVLLVLVAAATVGLAASGLLEPASSPPPASP